MLKQHNYFYFRGIAHKSNNLIFLKRNDDKNKFRSNIKTKGLAVCYKFRGNQYIYD